MGTLTEREIQAQKVLCDWDVIVLSGLGVFPLCF